MTLLVPFDGSELSATALERAVEFGEFMDETVLALSIIPDDEGFARDRGWIDDDEAFEPAAVGEELRRRVETIAPEADFELVQPDDVEGSSRTMDVIRTIRRVANDVDASILFVGSENVGRVTEPLASVGDPIARDQRYDVHIVRHTD